MSLITNWGYSLYDDDSFGAILTVADFNLITAGKYTSDTRVPALIDAATSAVRNYCGWHISPSLVCSFSDMLLYGNGRIKQVNNDLVIQLPATMVSEIQAVYIDQTEFERYVLDNNGLVHLINLAHVASRISRITVVYTAGVSAEMMAGVRELIASRVVHGLSGTAGVASETAGGVSISYANAWVMGGGAGQLTSLDAETLKPYRLQGVF